MTPIRFSKMHGLGNDFVVIDARKAAVALDAALVRAMGDRHRGVGFDQLAVITGDKDPHLTFWNADGTLSSACGNATRCIAAREMAARGVDHLRMTTDHGMLEARSTEAGVSVNMGAPVIDWARIPLAREVDTLSLPIEGAPVATSMGNPHCTFFVDDVEAIDLGIFGPQIEHHALYPERTNVQIAQILAPDRIRMRVWERGAGITLASGSSSCATLVAAARRGLTARRAWIALDGGDLLIDWREDGVWMTGPTAHVFDAEFTPSWLAQ